MAYYALMNEDNIVMQIISGVDENVTQTDSDGTQVGGSTEAWEQWYETRPWFSGLYCKRTSYNTRGNQYIGPNPSGTPFRGNYAGIGYTYDNTYDVFYGPQPTYPSWTLSHSTWLWQAPVPYPSDGKDYYWDEATLSWVEMPNQVIN